MILGLFETHINVTNLERSMQFYGEILGLELGNFEEERRVAFYWLGGRGEAMLGIWEKPANEVQRQHFAFRSSIEHILKARSYLEERGIEPRNFLNNGTKQPMVFAWMPALAIYFQDPDGHSLEFISMIKGKARPELGVMTLDVWETLEHNEQ